MSSELSPRGAAPAYDDAEKGVSEKVIVYPVEKKALTYPADEKKDLFVSEKKDVAAFQQPQVKRDPYALQKGAPKKKTSKSIIVKLWYNTYRYDDPISYSRRTRIHCYHCRKLFTIAFCINMIMFGFAVSGHWPYAVKYAGAFAVANFNVSILVRNEIFGRILYWLVNTLFAKVCLTGS